MSYFAKVTGLSGKDFFLDRCGDITEEKAKAQRFRSERAATEAAESHVASFEPCISRQLRYRVEVAQ